MSSIRHIARSDDAAVLDAAREAILDVGWRRTTLTDVARRAGLSRMTLYRRWPDMQALLADLMTREWAGLLTAHDGATPLEHVVVDLARRIRTDPLFTKIRDVDPELLLPYVLDRTGRVQHRLLEVLTTAIASGQDVGAVRQGDPTALARTLLLAVQGVVLSWPTVIDDALDEQTLEAELGTLVERYLAP